VAFLRFTRDKRGVENFYLVQPTTNRRGKVRPRVLYWFRSPPDVKVGREPFDVDMRRALEAQNPGIEFDWRGIIDTPIPSADADKWRERRRADRAAKHAAAEEDAKPSTGEEEAPDIDAETLAGDTISAAPLQAGEASNTAPAPLQTGDTISRWSDRDRRSRRRRRGRGGRDNSAPATQTTSDSAIEPSGD
jgi:hypothetical protein